MGSSSRELVLEPFQAEPAPPVLLVSLEGCSAAWASSSLTAPALFTAVLGALTDAGFQRRTPVRPGFVSTPERGHPLPYPPEPARPERSGTGRQSAESIPAKDPGG